jgi:hypothetical protein
MKIVVNNRFSSLLEIDISCTLQSKMLALWEPSFFPQIVYFLISGSVMVGCRTSVMVAIYMQQQNMHKKD